MQIILPKGFARPREQRSPHPDELAASIKRIETLELQVDDLVRLVTHLMGNERLSTKMDT